MSEFVAYFRVSTQRQGESGLGMDAQRAAVEAYVRQVGGTVASEYIEVESGKRADRPQLASAVALCRKRRSTLLIAKLDRLARNVHFVTGLMESGVPFVSADCPHDDKMMIQLRAVFAEEEGRKISARTKAALVAAKARGVRLGSPSPEKGSSIGVAAVKAKADAFAENVLPVIGQLRKSGVTSLNGLAGALNARGVRTARGGEWTATAVKRVEGRATG